MIINLDILDALGSCKQGFRSALDALIGGLFVGRCTSSLLTNRAEPGTWAPGRSPGGLEGEIWVKAG